ncbi:MAG: serine hydrolase [bacterium]|nr:serine hydrolase [bacterium]
MIALTFDKGSLGGSFFMLKKGRLEMETPLSDVRFRHPKIEFTAGPFPFEATVDLDLGTMKGKSTNRQGQQIEINATRRDPGDVPGLLAGAPDYSYRQPSERDDGWQTAAPEEVGLEQERLEELVRALIAGEGGVMHSLLIAKDGRMVLEEYFHGFGPEDLHIVQSCTKSIAAFLVGLAIDRGAIAGVSAPVLDFFPDLAAEAAQGWAEVKLEHLLTMTAGLAWEVDPTMAGTGGTGPESFRQVLTRRPRHAPGEVWTYSGPEVNLLAGVIHQATGVHADAFAAEHLFEPLGITEFDWSTWGKKEGYPELTQSLMLRPRDMAKIGALVADQGRWLDRQVVPAEWLRASTRSQVDTGDEEEDGYGYLWWLMERPDDPQKFFIAARGWGSQFILIDPEQRLIVVTTGGNSYNGKSFAVLGTLAQHFVPVHSAP